MKLSRRTMLRGLGGVSVALPFLESAGTVFGAAGQAPKRVVFIFSSTGSVRKNWKPATVGPNPAPTPILKPLCTPELKPYLTALSGLNMDAGGGVNTHLEGMATCMTASQNKGDFASGISIDTAIGKNFKGVTPFESLQFGVNTRNPPNGFGDSFITYREKAGGGVEGLYPEDNPITMYGKLFANISANGAPSPLMVQQLAQNRSVLDFVIDEHKRLAATLSGADRSRLEEHATMIRNLEQRLAIVNTTCTKPKQALTTVGSTSAGSNVRPIAEMHMDMIAAAFACDLTRVATLQFSTGESALNWDDVDKSLNFRASGTSWWHGISHQPVNWDPTTATGNDRDALTAITGIQAWFAERIASLAMRMKGYTDSDGKTVLDNSLIVWVTEVAEGNHRMSDMPYTAVGNLGGALKSNIHLAYNKRQHGDLFATIGTAMGLPGFTTFGRQGYSQGPLTDWLA